MGKEMHWDTSSRLCRTPIYLTAEPHSYAEQRRLCVRNKANSLHHRFFSIDCDKMH